MVELDSLDQKIALAFAGKAVRKDLVQQVKGGVNVPTYVLEYLLGKYCATNDEMAIQAGLRMVHSTLSDSMIRPDEAMKAQSRVKENGQQRFIDKVIVRLDGSKYWAELVNFGHRYIHIPDQFVRRYERLLEGGVWCQIDIEFRADEEGEGGKSRPFFITDIRPIQIASFDLQEYITGREQFTTDEWIDVLIRSIGFEASLFNRRVKLLMLIRLIPMVERNYNLIELGPRGTGKSYVYRDLSPYSILISGGKTTVANLFYNMSSRQVGLVGLWDVVAFDEVAGIQFSDKTAIQIMKDYMESGSFSRGREELLADASIVFNGNINQPVDVLLKTSTLFQPLPEDMQDMALIDRIHFYLPGWEMPKMRNDFFTDHYGFIVDYLAEVLRELRRKSFTQFLDQYFRLGSHINTRDARAIRRTVSGLLKLIHPSGAFELAELQEYLELAIEGRRRVKEQLKKMGSFEYYQTSFSYTNIQNMEEQFVGVPEEGGQHLISSDPLSVGSIYTVSLTETNSVYMCRIEMSKVSGNGKLRVSGDIPKLPRQSFVTAFDFAKSNKKMLGIEQEIETHDFNIQVVELSKSKEGTEQGVGFFVALYSLIRNKPVLPGLVVIGEMTIQGNILPINSLIEPLRVIMDNGARRVLIPTNARRLFLEVPPDILEKVDPVFYSDPLSAALKSLGIG